MISTTILKDETLQKQLDRDGYTVVPFADTAMLDELTAFYRSLDHLPSRGTYVTMFHPSYEYRKSVDTKIREICEAKAQQVMEGYRVLYTNFMMKQPGAEGDFPVHQDWTYVDESRSSSYAIWIPVQDVDETNGALHVVRGSHRFQTALRGPHIYEPFSKISGEIKERYATPVKLKAGEALIWDHRLIHFSRPNITTIPRLAFTLIMVPVGEPVIHCFGIADSPTGETDIYSVDTDFFMHYTISERPGHAPQIGHVAQPVINFSVEQFDNFFSNTDL